MSLNFCHKKFNDKNLMTSCELHKITPENVIIPVKLTVVSFCLILHFPVLYEQL